MNRLRLRRWSFRVSFLCPLALGFALSTLMACGSGPSEPNDEGEGPGEEQPGVMALTVLYTTNEQGQIEHWQNLLEAALSGVVGYLNEQLGKKSVALQNFVMDSWLATYSADRGGGSRVSNG